MSEGLELDCFIGALVDTAMVRWLFVGREGDALDVRGALPFSLASRAEADFALEPGFFLGLPSSGVAMPRR